MSEEGTFVQLRARDGRALLAGEAGDANGDQEAAGAQREVDPHSLALGADLAEALHEWARVADAVHRNGQADGSAAARLISRRGQQLAGRIAAVMGRPVSYADPLTGEVTEVEVPQPEPPAERPGSRRAPRHQAAEARTPWNTGLTVTFVTGVLMMIVVVTLSLALGAANQWLPLIANVVIAVGLAPSVWLARRAPVWRWVAFGVVGGIVVAWVALLFTAL
ncbi:MAG TPA: DUF2537 domain-containing protein [Pseudonocardiaceae bacterium]|nr:DUF2537 domain-containing protein [Pseudonocardiaceae bacterium]